MCNDWTRTLGNPFGCQHRCGIPGERGPFETVCVSMESTGHYGLWLTRWLCAHGEEVLLAQQAHARQRKELDDSTPIPIKTDAQDARVIARIVYDARCSKTPEHLKIPVP